MRQASFPLFVGGRMMRIKGPLVQKEAWVRCIAEVLAFIARRGEGTPPYEGR